MAEGIGFTCFDTKGHHGKIEVKGNVGSQGVNGWVIRTRSRARKLWNSQQAKKAVRQPVSNMYLSCTWWPLLDKNLEIVRRCPVVMGLRGLRIREFPWRRRMPRITRWRIGIRDKGALEPSKKIPFLDHYADTFIHFSNRSFVRSFVSLVNLLF